MAMQRKMNSFPILEFPIIKKMKNDGFPKVINRDEDLK
jgi:hypothetical protein